VDDLCEEVLVVGVDEAGGLGGDGGACEVGELGGVEALGA